MLYFGCCRPLRSGGRCTSMDFLSTLFLSVMANVIGYFVCKWLDREQWQRQPKKEFPEVAASGDSAFVARIYTIYLFFGYPYYTAQFNQSQSLTYIGQFLKWKERKGWNLDQVISVFYVMAFCFTLIYIQFFLLFRHLKVLRQYYITQAKRLYISCSIRVLLIV